MRSATLLALSLMFVGGVWSQDSARGQTSVAPPVSLAPPTTSPPHAGAKNSKPKGEPALVTTDRIPPAASGREASTPLIGGPPPVPNPAADYDGFSVGTVEDNDISSQVTPPVRSRAAKGSKSNLDTNGRAGQSSVDQEDEALKRKLTICQNCK
ncbi:hypothetical protein [Bradyrhizobium sp. AS23.2]|uniref:hypothetical protein n=1 Tax=Bradyrhizobium sp. AS23.2 TaxID=1680155 RepID=UPI00093A6E01|nr:hypothetical protein [Bradyrhizobium sp. AS23.2]OKO75223.1 hypothetical protein AC630_24900 [Bradyrhizobium sp. AS23.2]